MPTTTSKSRPFKKFFCDRPDVFLLPSSAFKVWMYHYAREGEERESWPSLPTIAEALNMNESTVKVARKFLRKNGWLKKTRERDAGGKFKIPVMTATRGIIPPQAEKAPMDHRGEIHLWTKGEKNTTVGSENPPTDRGGKTTTEVDVLKQVDSNEVDSLSELHSDEANLFAGTDSSEVNPVPSHSIEYRLTEQLRDAIRRNKPDFKFSIHAFGRWQADARRMVEDDKRDPEKVSALIDWVQRDPFWQSNVLSMRKLREKFDQLEMKQAAEKRAPSRHASFANTDYTAGLRQNPDGSYGF